MSIKSGDNSVTIEIVFKNDSVQQKLPMLESELNLDEWFQLLFGLWKDKSEFIFQSSGKRGLIDMDQVACFYVRLYNPYTD